MPRTKKGFTITELVIVLAIVAILAAVLIPTFANLIEKANQSVDVQLVRQMNTILKTDEAIDGKPANIDAVKNILADNGIVDPKPTLDTSVFAWDSEANVVVLMDKETATGIFPEEYEGVAYDPATWVIFGGTVNKNLPADASLADALASAKPGETIVLSGDQTLGADALPAYVNIDLDGHKLTLTNGLNMAANSSVTISNGDVESQEELWLPTGAHLTLNDVDYTCEETAFIPTISSQIDINGGTIIADSVIRTGYSVGNIHDIILNITDATLGSEANPCGVAIMMITSGDIAISNSTIYADEIAIAQRCGNVTVKNTTINYLRTEEYKDTFLGSDGTATNTPNDLRSQSWLGGIGDTTGAQVYVGPSIRAPIVLGDFRAKHYSYDANCVLESVTFNTSKAGYPDVYLSQENYDVLKADGTIVPGTEEIVKTTLTCDNTVNWVVNPGKNDAFVDYAVDGKEIFALYSGFYYSSSGFGGTALHYVDNVFVNGVEQAPGSTSANNVVAGDLAVKIPEFVGILATTEQAVNVLDVNYPSSGNFYDYTADVIQALKDNCGLELTKEQLISSTLTFGSTPNALKTVTYTKDGTTTAKNVTGTRLFIPAIEHLGLTGTQSGSVLINAPTTCLDTFKTFCAVHGITLTDSSKIVIGANNTIIGVK